MPNTYSMKENRTIQEGQIYMENRLLFGTAYYPEYMPYERTDQDIAMMKAAGMNTVRIAESTWRVH